MLLGSYKTRIVIFFPNRMIIVSLHNACLRNTSSLRHALLDVNIASPGFFFFFGAVYVSQSFYFQFSVYLYLRFVY